MTSATVDEAKKILYIGTDKGQILTRPITEDELADYRNHPDTFFGVVHKQSIRTDSEYDFYEHMVDIHTLSPKSSILKQIENWYDVDKL